MRGRGWVVKGTRGLRAVPGILREDLWTTAADPLPRRSGPSWLDWLPALALPVVLGAVVLFIACVDKYGELYGFGQGLGVLLAAVQSVALAAALFRPVPAWWAMTAVTMVIVLTARPGVISETTFPWSGEGLTVQALVLFLLALRTRPRIAVEVLAISVLVGLVSRVSIEPGPPPESDAGFFVSVLVTAVVVGTALRGRRVARARLVEQEEITAEERARRTLLEERNRIARELHDVVAHHMSVISIQAQVAPHLAENPSDELKENLAGIRRSAVEALTELRRVLGVLRSEDALADGVRHAPQPTLDRLEELVDTVRGTGIPVDVEIHGERRPLPPGLELSAFRIVQEALSNVMRHAPGAEVKVEIGYHPDGLTVWVVNTAPDRPALPTPGAGHGLLGMRERTAMLRGELATGPTPDGGYEVAAVLPAYHATEAARAETATATETAEDTA
ncbi:sensor histidine kinase [Streptomyces sp. RTd22]|uniref:sensor histidine kinase n=1 Tax=Streptomyces sp. RTd22 TaxID=1841249 RepID=UPI000D19BF81|nr:sensor histidine kinase [Streptomyces sp. RTd22]